MRDARLVATRLVVALVAVAALVPAVINAAHAAHAGAYLAARYRSASGQPERRLLTAMEHLGEQMGREIPAGALVYVDEPDGIWWFRLQELAAMHGVTTVGDRGRADVVLRRRVDPRLPDGMGLELTAVAR
ncbi:hypothetical protein ACQP2P_11725 [Dactylosporangium sp. CA-139114]|uniref:hypothetical protein n=1 Tax=Dactylosporangium sp. CA-139114 TaxID=3239931 RepID=UPI003D966D6E